MTKTKTQFFEKCRDLLCGRSGELSVARDGWRVRLENRAGAAMWYVALYGTRASDENRAIELAGIYATWLREFEATDQLQLSFPNSTHYVIRRLLWLNQYSGDWEAQGALGASLYVRRVNEGFKWGMATNNAISGPSLALPRYTSPLEAMTAAETHYRDQLRLWLTEADMAPPDHIESRHRELDIAPVEGKRV